MAPQTNITIAMPNGMIVQSSSSASDPWMSAPTSSSCLRRNLIAKNTTSAAISTEKNAVTATMKKKTRIDLARLGRRGFREERKVLEHR